MADLTKVDPLQAWVQTVLPTVYDDSLSYLEFLGKVKDKINELIASDLAQSTALAAFLNAYEANLAELMSGGDTSLHKHDDQYFTETEALAQLLAKVDKITGYSLIADSAITALTGGTETTLHKHAASGIVNTPAGNIAATNVQTAINELDTEKASKTQEDWITPTLLNSWAAVSIYVIQYRKNQLGNVEIRGRVTGGAAGTAVFTLPAGYRPPYTQFWVSQGNSAVSYGNVDTNGNVNLQSGGATNLNLNLTIFI